MDLLNIVSTLANVDEMKKLIECPVCLEIPLPPIYLCKRGHIVCNSCQRKTVVCPLCRDNFSTTRSFVAEGIVEKCTMRCKFSDQGCPSIMTGDELIRHIKICSYRPLRCNECLGKWINFGEYMNHLETAHHMTGMDIHQGGVVYSMNFKASALSGRGNYLWPPFTFKAFGKTFLFRVVSINKTLLAYVFGHGANEDFEPFEVLIKLYVPSEEMNFGLTWVGRVFNSRDDPYADILNKGNGLILPLDTVANIAEAREFDGIAEWAYFVRIYDHKERKVIQAKAEFKKRLQELRAVSAWHNPNGKKSEWDLWIASKHA